MQEPAHLDLLEIEGVSKAFGSNRVLKDVSFRLGAGEVLALVGENGAGKSTLMNIIAGGLGYDEGRISFEGAPYRPSTPKAAKAFGVAIAHQETTILPDLTVGENVFFGGEPRNAFGLIRQNALHRAAEALFAELGFQLRVDKIGADLSPAERQLAEIAKALRGEPKLLVLDEPTAALSAHEARLVLAAMARLRGRGGSVLFISHRLDEVIECADRALVLKDGALTLDARRGAFDRGVLVRAMVGRQLAEMFPPRPSTFAGAKSRFGVAAAEAPGLKRVSFDIREGEILGFAGLEGQGQRPLARALSGVAPFRKGAVTLDGAPIRLSSVAAGIRAGVATIPEDRKHEGLALDLPMRMNVSLFALSKFTRWGLLPFALEREFSEKARQRFGIRTTGIDQPVRELSGGNQQKVVFSRWLAETPKLLALYEPTKGIDVGAKTEIYRLVGELTAAGVAVALISSDMLELIGLSDRIAVLYAGGIVGALDRPDFSEEEIMRLAAGPAGEGALHDAA